MTKILSNRISFIVRVENTYRFIYFLRLKVKPTTFISSNLCVKLENRSEEKLKSSSRRMNSFMNCSNCHYNTKYILVFFSIRYHTQYLCPSRLKTCHCPAAMKFKKSFHCRYGILKESPSL
jgi:hypothetical protein